MKKLIVKIKDWIASKRCSKKPKRKECEYLISFEVLQNPNGIWESHSIITDQNIEKFLEEIRTEHYKVKVTFMIKL